MPKKWKHDRKSFHLSIVSMILWINLCGIIILTAFNYYVFQHKNGKAYQESFISYNQQVTNLAFKNIDQQIMQAVLELPQLYFSPIDQNRSLLLPQTESIADSSEHIMALSMEMQKLQKSYPYLSGIDIYYEATDTIITQFNHVHFPTDEDERDRYLPWYADYRRLDAQTDKDRIWTSGTLYPTNESAILYINRISRPGWGSDSIILCTAISPAVFSNYIDQSAGSLLITAGDGQILYGGNEWGDLSIPSPEDSPRVHETGDFIIFQSTSPSSGLNYYYAVDSTLFYRDYTAISHTFLVNFLLSLIFNVILLLVISYYNHSAYRSRVRVLSEKTGISMDDSERSFDGSLNLLEKEILNLHEAVDSSRGLVLQSGIRSALLSETSLPPEDALLPYLTRPLCQVILIDFPQADAETLPVEELQEDYPAGREGYDVLFAAVDKQKLAAVLIFENGLWENVIADFIQDMNGRWKDYRMVSGAISPTGQEGMRSSYQCAAEAARYQYIFTDQPFLSYDELHIPQRKNEGSHLKIFEAVRKDINSSNLLELKAHIEMLVTSFKTGHYTIDYCRSTLRDLVTLLYQVMQQNQLDTWMIFGYGIRTYYQKIENIDSFQTWCNMACEMILKNICQKRQSVDEDMRLKILHFVDEHLENDISLDLLADRLQIRPDNASRLFRQVMGTGYTEYIKTRKLKRAEDLMAQGCSVKDTAEKLGYSSAQYFIKVFKENYGMTPHQYKKSRENEASVKTRQ